MEDIARFTLDDGDLCGTLKGIRHGLREAIDGLAAAGVDRGLLLAHRDTPGDVGTGISTAAEGRREGLRDLGMASGSRLAESLRALEEAAKVFGLGAAFEALRYRAYDAERRLALGLGTGRCPQWRLCVLVSESLCAGRAWMDVVNSSLAGGADCIQLREKEMDGRELLKRARTLVEMARPHGAAVIINDRPDIALLSDADGVHVGQTDLSVEEVRRLAGFGLLVGVSTTNLDQARAAIRAGADYLGLGPMFPTMTKLKPTLAGPRFVGECLADTILSERPHLAIGGITPENARELRDVGCRGIAVSSAVCAAPDPQHACRDLIASLTGTPTMPA